MQCFRDFCPVLRAGALLLGQVFLCQNPALPQVEGSLKTEVGGDHPAITAQRLASEGAMLEAHRLGLDTVEGAPTRAGHMQGVVIAGRERDGLSEWRTQRWVALLL
jgi:hypothetical protein